MKELYEYLNIHNLNKTLSNKDFEEKLPYLIEKLYSYGFKKLLEDYNKKLKDVEEDYIKLKKVVIEKDYISSTSLVGMAIIKKYMTHIYDVKNHKGICISDNWTKQNIEKVLRLNRKTHSTPYVSEIIRQLGFMSGTSKITIYRPLLTKRIIQSFTPKKVLDVCVGWGGRMLGSVCVDGVHYTGIEPNTKTFKELKKMEFKLKLQDQVKLINDVAEKVLPTLTETYDLAITSPPYYNLEIYTDEETQSHHYGNYDVWVDKFLKPVVHGVIDHLKEEGHSCWSVKNIKTDKSYPLYDDIVRLHEEKGWRIIDREFYISNCLRPGLKDTNGNSMKSKESTFVFMKI